MKIVDLTLPPGPDGGPAAWVESPRALFPGAVPVAATAPNQWVGQAQVLRIRTAGPGAVIGVDDLKAAAMGLHLPGTVLIATGWADHAWGSSAYFQASPHLTAEAALWLAAQRVRFVGMDFCPDAGGTRPEARETLLANGILVGKGFARLHRLPTQSFLCVCAPLLTADAGEAPARFLGLLESESEGGLEA